MTTLTEDLELPGGVDPATVTVRLELWGDGQPVTGFEQGTGKTIAGPLQVKGNPWSITNVVGNADIDAPAGTVYRVVRTWAGLREPLVDFLDVPTSGTVRVDQCLTDEPAAVESSALTTHRNRRTIHGALGGVHGVIEHRWERDGWAPMQRKVITQDGAQAFALTVDGDHGVWTGPAAGLGQQRELFIHEDTLGWTAGEITALIGRPSTFVAGVNTPQAGVVVGYELIGGHHVALVVWVNIAFTDPDVQQVGGWRGNGGTEIGLAAGGSFTAAIKRDLRILQVQRFQFFNWINGHIVQPYHLHDLATGDLVNIDVDDATFDETSIAAASVDRNSGVVQVVDPVHTSAVSLKVADGVISHAAGHKRWFPFIVKARRDDAVVSAKAWRTTESEPPDWQAVITVATDADYPQLPAGGGFGVLGGHAHSGSSGRYGPLTIRRLD